LPFAFDIPSFNFPLIVELHILIPAPGAASRNDWTIRKANAIIHYVRSSHLASHVTIVCSGYNAGVWLQASKNCHEYTGALRMELVVQNDSCPLHGHGLSFVTTWGPVMMGGQGRISLRAKQMVQMRLMMEAFVDCMNI
jgi:hypothetical protein